MTDDKYLIKMNPMGMYYIDHNGSGSIAKALRGLFTSPTLARKFLESNKPAKRVLKDGKAKTIS